MRILFLSFLLFSHSFIHAQLPFLGDKEPDGKPEIHYYKFYNGVQMIEFDYLSAYHKKVNYLEQAQPRALTWEMVLGPPHPNVYLFRNENGEVIKQFGSYNESDLVDVEKSKKIAICHNSISSMFGSVIGFSQIGTRYFPYYLIGNSQGGQGLIDSLGNTVLEQNYSTIWKGDGVFITRTLNSVYELRDRNLRLRFSDPDYFLQPSQQISGFVDVGKDKKYGLMDSTGAFIVKCRYSMLIGGFNYLGLARVERKEK
ncbi:MAG: WG repeat-containing protein [Bacteroidia bacterium]